MTASQKELINELTSILASGPKNTRQIRIARRDRQTYETNLRDRLFRLADRGLLAVNNTTRGRFWSLPKTEGGAE